MSEIAEKVSLDLGGLIKQGITDAKGSEKAIYFLTEDDLKGIGRMLADREAARKGFFSVTVAPINDIEAGKAAGHYDSVYDWINAKHVPLQNAAGTKRIYFVPVTETVPEGGEAEYVKRKSGLKLVEHAPNYLLGAMAALQESDIPAELKGKDFVAASEDPSEVFAGEDGVRCFLFARRSDGERKLDLIHLKGEWRAGLGWVFLAEEL